MAPDTNSIFAAAIPEPYRVLGLKLRPFSLGHYVTLHRHGSAFVSDRETNASREDLIFAAIVCSMTFEEFNEWIDSGPLPFWRKLGAVLRFLFFQSSLWELMLALKRSRAEYEAARWGRRIGHFDFAEKVRLFKRYVDEHSEMPKFWEEKEPKASGGHWAQSVFLTLTGELGFTASQAWNLCLREAFLHFFKHAESMGAVRLMDESELEAIHG